MRKALFVVITLSAFFLAGMFSYLPLLVLCIAMVLLAGILWVQSRYVRHFFSVSFQKHREQAVKNSDFCVKLLVSYTGRIPAGIVRIPVYARYPQGKSRRLVRVTGEASGKDSAPAFLVHAPYCGLLTLTFTEFRTFDSLSLFGPKKPIGDTMRVAVYPGDASFNIASLLKTSLREETLEEENRNVSGEPSMEIRQLKEYRPGDTYRRIHWNVSARTDTLWVKEYEHEADGTARLMLDGEGAVKKNPGQMSAFYELVSALILGLLEEVSTVWLIWQDADTAKRVERKVSDSEACREALYRLYGTKLGDALPASPEEENGFRLTASLTLYFQQQIIRQFSEAHLADEIGRPSEENHNIRRKA